MHETVIHNLMALLECGAFCTIGGQEHGHEGGEEGLLPMSPHKWRTLARAAEELAIMPYVARGAERLKGHAALPTAFLDGLAGPGKASDLPAYDTSQAQLYNHWTAKHLEEVREEELNSPTLSEETLTVLDILVANADDIITRDVSVSGIVWLGCYVRRNHYKIDFAKLQSWLRHIGMVRMASLQGSMLVRALHFRPDELPFVVKRHKKADRLFMRSLTMAFQKHSCSTATRMDVAMLETVSHRFMAAISLITDVEE